MSEDNKDISALDMEREELNLLVRHGMKFDTTITVRRRKKGLRGFFSKPETTEERLWFEIHEPTLSVLDRVSDISLDMAVAEEALRGEDMTVIAEAKNMVKNNALRMARMIAIAVMGEDYHITEIGRTGRVKKYNDDKELERLTDLFFHSIKPSKMAMLATVITNTSNLGDFISSMRLLSGARTTQPRKDRIE